MFPNSYILKVNLLNVTQKWERNVTDRAYTYIHTHAHTHTHTHTHTHRVDSKCLVKERATYTGKLVRDGQRFLGSTRAQPL